MRGRVSQWGNILIIRIPGIVTDKLKLRDGCIIDLHLDGTKVVIKKARPRYNLSTLDAEVGK